MDISGEYDISGVNPSEKPKHLSDFGYKRRSGKYTGKLKIVKVGLTYHLVWEITTEKSTQKMNGTGILNGDILSVVFRNSNKDQSGWVGVVSYRINSPGELEGKWTDFHGEEIGMEECNRVSLYW